ncbi:MIP/aquaporin family protein [Bifidobacterium catulorum]|uniref:Glycerol transporter n=1 Tax=Bifidobacterium catulorum TaxID=1630173 RepID=A0A2U2MV80_9BIFI|nr:aquaporin [Bifidobacterium catulorum]PWG60744.1 glycerol transporter [Bifidobacterium catulorum]
MSETQTIPERTCHPYALSPSPVIRTLAEFAGTFLVCFAIYAAGSYGMIIYGANALFFAFVAGLAYAAVTVVFARFSGGHFNPAVTLAAVLTSKTSWLDGILYLVAQLLGATAAGFLAVNMLPTAKNVALSIWLGPAVNGYGEGSPSNSVLSQAGVTFGFNTALIVEVAMSLLVVAATFVTLRDDGSPMHSHTSAVAISYGAATAVAYPITGAGLNPVRSTGIALFAHGQNLTVDPFSQLWLFWACPLLAGAIVALASLAFPALNRAMIGKAGNATTESDTESIAESGTQDTTGGLQTVDLDDKNDDNTGIESDQEQRSSEERQPEDAAAPTDDDTVNEPSSTEDGVSEASDAEPTSDKR